MRLFDAWALFFYGEIRALGYVRAGMTFREASDIATDAAAFLQGFIVQYRQDELRNAVAAAEALRDFIRGTLYPVRDNVLNETHIALLENHLKEFETALKLDLGALPIYVLENKRGYSARQFVAGSGARTVFSAQEQTQLPRACLEDIDHAGKCLMHEQFTAAGFHIIRGLEGATRIYYERVKGSPPISAKGAFLPLGVMTSVLKDEFSSLTNKDEGALGEIVLLLERINRIYRNPIMHPEMTLNEELAIKVFDTAKLIIDEMLDDMGTGYSYFASNRRSS